MKSCKADGIRRSVFACAISNAISRIDLVDLSQLDLAVWKPSVLERAPHFPERDKREGACQEPFPMSIAPVGSALRRR